MTSLGKADERPRVVVVDHAEASRRATAAILEVSGFSVLDIAGWGDFVGSVTKHKPSAVVLGQDMPGMKCEDLLKLVWKFFPDVPAVVLSAGPEDRIASLRASGAKVVRESDVASGLPPLLRDLIRVAG